MIRTFLQTAAFFVLQAALLFGPGGTWAWPAAWGYLGVQVLMVVAVWAAGDPDMLRSRSRWEAGARR